MKTEFKFTIDLEDQSEVQSVVNTFTKLLNSEAKPTKVKAETQKAAKVEAAPDKVEVKKEEAAVSTTTEAKASSAGVKIEAIREKVTALAPTHREQIKAKLSELGAKNASSLDPSHYDGFFTFLNELK